MHTRKQLAGLASRNPASGMRSAPPRLPACLPAAGAPLTPAALVPSEREEVKVDLARMSLEQIAVCPDVSDWIR